MSGEFGIDDEEIWINRINQTGNIFDSTSNFGQAVLYTTGVLRLHLMGAVVYKKQDELGWANDEYSSMLNSSGVRVSVEKFQELEQLPEQDRINWIENVFLDWLVWFLSDERERIIFREQKAAKRWVNSNIEFIDENIESSDPFIFFDPYDPKLLADIIKLNPRQEQLLKVIFEYCQAGLDFTYKDIANQLGISVGAVRKRIKRLKRW